MNTSKKCIGCGEEKPLDDFYRNHTGYYQSRCKPCNVEQVKKYRAANPDKRRKFLQDWRVRNRNTPRMKAAQIFENMVVRSKRKGFDYPEWTRPEIEKIVTNGKCSKTGMAFEFDQSKFPRSPWTPVPDRIDSCRGYTRDNVQWVCHMYNSMKQDFTEVEIELFLNALCDKRHRKGTA